MRAIRATISIAVLIASVGLALVALPASAQDGSAGEKQILRVGWAQDPRNLNPFTALDEEDYTIWAINWDQLVDFDPKTLSPAPGIAQSWEVSDDRRTVTFTLAPDMLWSDGKPITSADVKYSLETLGEQGALFAGYTSGISSIKTPDDRTVVVETKRPDARIIGGLFVYMLPKHVWDKQSIDDLTGDYQPKLPLVGSGPYVVTDFQRNKIITMERNQNFRGDPGPYDEIQFIKYGTQDAVERALQLGEIDLVREVSSAGFGRLGGVDNVDTQRSASPGYTQLAFNLCPAKICPDAKFNPAVQDKTVRQAIAYGIDREKLVEIATRGTSFPGHGILPTYYKDFYTQPEQDYPFDPDRANQMLDDAGWAMGGDGVRSKDGVELKLNLYARTESPETIQDAKLIAEMGKAIGVEFDVQPVSTDKLTQLTIKKENGKPAPDFDTFIWGWGGDPYDPSFLLSILTTGEIGGSSDSFYSNPAYDALYREQSGIFDTDERRAVIQKMIAMTQEDLPYLVLTEDPELQAYRTDTIDQIKPICPAETGDLFCDQVSWAGILALNPIIGGGGGGSDTTSPGLTGLIGLAIGFAGGLLVARGRRRGGSEPLELPE